MKVTVIVPVYKAEAYLHKCVDSLLAQTMTDFEVLLIDDGSPDRSGAICDEYAAKDSRIRVFHKENGGVASARQVGIENVRGEYTIHADPDDWVEPTMLEELYAKAKEDDADMVICDYYEEMVDSQKYIKQNLTDDLSSKTLLGLLLGQKLHGSLCNKLIKTDKIKEYELFLPKEVIRWEDLFFCCNLLLHPIKSVYLSRAFYHYNLFINENSIVRKATIAGLMSQVYFCDYFDKKFESLDDVFYSDVLSYSKASTKELAYNSRLKSPKEVKCLYSEINEWYCSKRPNNIISLGVKLSIKCPLLGLLYLVLFKMYLKLRSMLKK